jgi:hypothetical protein
MKKFIKNLNKKFITNFEEILLKQNLLPENFFKAKSFRRKHF